MNPIRAICRSTVVPAPALTLAAFLKPPKQVECGIIRRINPAGRHGDQVLLAGDSRAAKT